jgi:hypothetical protein
VRSNCLSRGPWRGKLLRTRWEKVIHRLGSGPLRAPLEAGGRDVQVRRLKQPPPHRAGIARAVTPYAGVDRIAPRPLLMIAGIEEFTLPNSLKGWACSSGCRNAWFLRCLVWAGAECQEHSSEYSGEEWAAGNEQELSRYGQAGRDPNECCPKG